MYEADGKTNVFSFKERIESVVRDGGCFHMKQPVTYIIDHQHIIGIKLYCSSAGFYQDIKMQEVERWFGKASVISKRYFPEDDSLSSIQYSYEERQIYIDVSAELDKISNIHFGVFPFKISWMKKFG